MVEIKTPIKCSICIFAVLFVLVNHWRRRYCLVIHWKIVIYMLLRLSPLPHVSFWGHWIIYWEIIYIILLDNYRNPRNKHWHINIITILIICFQKIITLLLKCAKHQFRMLKIHTSTLCMTYVYLLIICKSVKMLTIKEHLFIDTLWVHMVPYLLTFWTRLFSHKKVPLKSVINPNS